jgi:hypothetical protein
MKQPQFIVYLCNLLLGVSAACAPATSLPEVDSDLPEGVELHPTATLGLPSHADVCEAPEILVSGNGCTKTGQWYVTFTIYYPESYSQASEDIHPSLPAGCVPDLTYYSNGNVESAHYQCQLTQDQQYQIGAWVECALDPPIPGVVVPPVYDQITVGPTSCEVYRACFKYSGKKTCQAAGCNWVSSSSRAGGDTSHCEKP